MENKNKDVTNDIFPHEIVIFAKKCLKTVLWIKLDNTLHMNKFCVSSNAKIKASEITDDDKWCKYN